MCDAVEEKNEETTESKEEIDFSNFTLDPDHPLLEPFQKALKEHLQNQIVRLKEELYEIEDDVKRKESEILEVGVKTYDSQQQVCSQQKILDNLMQEIKIVSADQEKEEKQLECNKKELKKLQERLFETEKTNREMTKEIESVNTLTQKLAESETKMESHLNVNKRIAEKSRTENEQLAKEKKKQDFLIHQLMTEVWKLETDIETSKLQISVKEEELEELETKIAIGNTNITALESELRALLTSWNSVVVAISNRDKGLDCLTQEMRKQEEKRKNILTEIGQCKKFLKQELLQNERLTAFKERVQMDIDSSKDQLKEQMAEKKILDKNYYDVQMIVEQTEIDIKVCQQECHKKEVEYTILEHSSIRMTKQQCQIEQEILKCIEGEISSDVYGKKSKKTLKDMTAKRRDLEVILSEVENKKSLLSSEIESQKFKIEELNRINDETKLQMGELEDLEKKLKSEFERFELLYRKREKQVLTLNEKLEEKLSTPDLDKITKAEMRITELNKLIEECQQTIKTLQMFWMREQKNILAVSKERQDQIHNISLLKKQVLILEQKNVRICDKIEELKKREEKTFQSINILTSKAAILCDNVFKKKNKKTNLDKNNALLQGKFDSKLKEAELVLLQIEGEIADIEDEKLALSKELIEINREGLEWEKKFHMTKNAVDSLRENKKCGDVANMRQEIHKMEVIYGGLKRAQEKLLKDLQDCVSKRDNMFYFSDAKQKLEKSKKTSGTDRSRVNFQKKIDNVKNQMKQTKNEIKSMQNKYKQAENKVEEISKEIDKKRQNPVFDKRYESELIRKLEHMKINRQFKFEVLVFQQKKAQMYSIIAENKIPYTIFRKEEELINEYEKEKKKNDKLIQVIENLNSDFPEAKNEFIKMRNTLGIVALFMYTQN